MSVALRSVLFHNVEDSATTFTDGLGVTTSTSDFENRIKWLSAHYRPVSLKEVEASVDGAALPRRSLLITIDDAYSSVGRVIAPILERYGLPAVFFVNSGFLDHQQLNIDNLVAHVHNTLGGEALTAAAKDSGLTARPSTIAETLQKVVPSLPLEVRKSFALALTGQCAHDPLDAAREVPLYMSASELRDLPDSIEIGSHTTSHVRCRMLQSAAEYADEIAANCEALESITRRPVSPFSVPYGSAVDRPRSVVRAAHSAGHQLIFLVEGRLNHGVLDTDGITRVSLTRRSTLGALSELEVEPRLRHWRNRIRWSR